MLRSAPVIKKFAEGSGKNGAWLILLSGVALVLKLDQTGRLAAEVKRSSLLPLPLIQLIPRRYFIENTGNFCLVMEEYVGPTLTMRSPGIPLTPIKELPKVLKVISNLFKKTKKSGFLDIEQFYFRRIKEKIALISEVAPKFKNLIETRLNINGQKFLELGCYIDLFRQYEKNLQPRFLTAIHGDLFPENITIDKNGRIRFIDISPYEDPFGDYLYDFGTFLWWLKSLGAPTNRFMSLYRDKIKISIRSDCIHYQIPATRSLESTIRKVYACVASLANAFSDLSWGARVRLAEGYRYIDMARKALVKYKDEDCAILLYAFAIESFNESRKILEVIK
jgi:serine/threonine protein kinase